MNFAPHANIQYRVCQSSGYDKMAAFSRRDFRSDARETHTSKLAELSGAAVSCNFLDFVFNAVSCREIVLHQV